ncbi:hypothetical protein OAE05_00865 [Gammaproteobacteria bacterium]|nr:hypothetical protein [Gammaproteobacteria bacterium]
MSYDVQKQEPYTMNPRIKSANTAIRRLLDESIFNENISDSMKYFQDTSYRFHFLLAFMYRVMSGKETTQEAAIRVVPGKKIASRATRVTELKKAVKAGYIIEEKSIKDKRARVYKPSDEMFSDFLKMTDDVFFPELN